MGALISATVQRLLAKLALDRPELRAWAFYDWANSAMITVIVTAVFPIYFSEVASADVDATKATERFGLATTIGLLIVAPLSPILGALADRLGSRKRFLFLFLLLGCIATGLMFFIQRGDWVLAMVLFVIANVGVSGSFVFYDSLLPHVARENEVDRLSAAGYALGYLGGGLLLAGILFAIQNATAFGASTATVTRASFVVVAVWWLVFSIPLFRRIREPDVVRVPKRRSLLLGPVLEVVSTLRRLRAYPQAFLVLIAFLIYNDGIVTIIRMATVYGREIGVGRDDLILAIILVQFIGLPFTLLFGLVSTKIGTKRSILLGLSVYFVVALVGYFMKSASMFYVLAILIGVVQGGTQSLSRSLFANLIPKERSAEFFGFFAVVERFASVLGPAVFTIVVATTDQSRLAVLMLMVFFAVGGGLLLFVNEEEGRAAVRSPR